MAHSILVILLGYVENANRLAYVIREEANTTWYGAYTKVWCTNITNYFLFRCQYGASFYYFYFNQLTYNWPFDAYRTANL